MVYAVIYHVIYIYITICFLGISPENESKETSHPFNGCYFITNPGGGAGVIFIIKTTIDI